MSELTFQKVQDVPLTEDLIKLRKFLDKKMVENFNALRLDTNIQNWRELAVLTVAKIILFNKRRSSEGSKMKIKQYEDRPKWKEGTIQEISKSLSLIETQLYDR